MDSALEKNENSTRENSILNSKVSGFSKSVKDNKELVGIGVLLTIFLVLSVITYFDYKSPQKLEVEQTVQEDAPISNFSNIQKEDPSDIVNVTSPQETPVELPVELEDFTPLENLSSEVKLRIPFIRDHKLFLYEDGNERLIAESKWFENSENCYFLQYPLMSPDGNFIAYQEQVGNISGYGGCTQGMLRIVDIQENIVKATKYAVGLGSYKWSSDNKLIFNSTILNPETLEELVSGDNFPDKNYEAFIPYSDSKVMVKREDSYYIFNPKNDTEELITNKEKVNYFQGWSPNGKYAVFSTSLPLNSDNNYGSQLLVIDLSDGEIESREIYNPHGAAGGSFNVGLSWYFNKAFVSHCSQALTFVNGSDYLTLTTSGGGGCHNSGGFVSNSPDGEFSFVKFDDRFEVHSKDGDVKIVEEVDNVYKSRGSPSKIFWANNNTVVLYDYVVSSPVNIYVYSLDSNKLTKAIENAFIWE